MIMRLILFVFYGSCKKLVSIILDQSEISRDWLILKDPSTGESFLPREDEKRYFG